MGEVYKAHDPRLAREVAIKVLTASCSVDPDRLRRFEQEARAAAALNHPGILAVFDIGTHDGSPYIVSELLAGETLRARLAAGPLPLRKTVDYAIQIARALAAAHDKGILHRDLKPENVFVTTDGHVKILDFGLAKLVEPDAARGNASQLPTVAANTEPGMMLGTMGYMAPEQVRGQPVDHRTDLFAFGALLYEMVSGQRAFPGATPADTITAVLEKQPPDAPLTERHIPPGLGRIIDRCLEKTPVARFQSTRDLTFALEALDTSSSASGAQVAPAAVVRGASSGAWRLAAIGLLVAVVILAWPALQYFLRPSPEAPLARFGVDTPPTPESFSFALSLDGRQLAFVAAEKGVPRVWTRPLDQMTAQPVAGTEGASGVFWAPNAKSVGFFADNKLKRVDLPGGAPLELADAPLGRGGTWNRDDVILFAPSTTAGLSRVAATGGPVTVVTKPGNGQGSHRWPQFLPGGHRFLFFSALGQLATRGVYVASLDGGDPVMVTPSDAAGLFAPPGYLLLGVQGSLVVRRFDPEGGKVSGEPAIVAQSLGMDDGTLRSAFAVSESGVIAYRSGTGGNRRQLHWIDRSGKVLGTVGTPDETALAFPTLSPDGRYVAVARTGGSDRTGQGGADVWLIEVARASVSRFTSDPDADTRPVWSPDSSRIVFASTRKGSWTLFEKPANRSHDEQPLVGVAQANVAPLDWSSDGRYLLYSAQDPKTASDLWALPMSGGGAAIPIATSSFDETQGEFSPDGHWIVYVSNETGRNEVYVRRFPDGSGTQVSIDGGRFPRWKRDGHELFFLSPDNHMLATPLTVSADGRTATPGVPVPLFVTHLASGANIPTSGYISRPQYVVAPDGRFLMNVSLEDLAAPPITVVLNWTSALGGK
jgi:Tol biopolymer transport system component